MSSQVFAARGRRRPATMKAMLVVGTVLVAAWVAALGLGALGGFESLPRPDISFDDGDSAIVAGDPRPDQPAPTTTSALRDPRRPNFSPPSTGGLPARPRRATGEAPSVTLGATTGGVPAPDGIGITSDVPGIDASGSHDGASSD